MSIHDANEIDTNRVIKQEYIYIHIYIYIYRCEAKALQFKASCMALSYRCEAKALQFKASCMALSASYSACLNHSNDISHRNWNKEERKKKITEHAFEISQADVWF